ncbi:uncharacterized protein LOC126695008 [Quercus robur]|uniref:uncharacterized protein LOC126695008 n=1 Tax=Quercus robur TaxID=38942 RepID=UPI0021633B3E|nr:uncharacterized protein LOC126695008 [Quercus robur]
MGVKEKPLSRKRSRDNESSNREDPVVTSSTVMPALQHPTSPTSSLEMITPTNEVAQRRGQDKAMVGTFWDEADCAIAKAHDAISVKDLKPLTTKPLNELMYSHIHKIMQVLGESLHISGKYLDYEEKFAVAQSKVDSLSSEK